MRKLPGVVALAFGLLILGMFLSQWQTWYTTTVGAF
jgi:hypothetical protein